VGSWNLKKASQAQAEGEKGEQLPRMKTRGVQMAEDRTSYCQVRVTCYAEQDGKLLIRGKLLSGEMTATVHIL
jgi:hypothetical protein